MPENVEFDAGRGADRPDAAAAREGDAAARGNPAGFLLHFLPAEARPSD